MKALDHIFVSSRQGARRAATAFGACIVIALAFGAVRGSDDYQNAPSPEIKPSAERVRVSQRRPDRPNAAPRSRAATPTTIPNTSNRSHNTAPKGYGSSTIPSTKAPRASQPLAPPEREPSVFSKLLHIPSRDKSEDAPEGEAKKATETAAQPNPPQVAVQTTPRSASKAGEAAKDAPTVAQRDVSADAKAKAAQSTAKPSSESKQTTASDAQADLPPLEDFDEYELAEILRPFAELNEQNARETKSAPTAGSGEANDVSNLSFPDFEFPDLDPTNSAPAPSPTRRDAKDAAGSDGQDYEAFISELDEIHELERTAQEAEETPSFGYFKSQKPAVAPQKLEEGAVVSRPISEPTREASDESAPAEGENAPLDAELGETPTLDDLDLDNLDLGALETPASEEADEASDALETNAEETSENSESDDAELLADRRVFGETRPIDANRAVGRQGYLPTKRANFRPVSVNQFNSNAYARSETPVAKEPPAEALELDDVVEFTEDGAEESEEENNFLGAAIVDASELTEDDKALDSANVESIKDECFLALDHYSSLFIAYEPTAEWTETALELVDEILGALDTNPKAAQKAIKKLKEHVADGADVKARVLNEGKSENSRRNPWNEEERPEIVARYSTSQRVGLFDSFVSALERRAFLWNCAAEYFEAKNNGELVEQPELSTREIEVVLKTARDVQAFFGDTPNGRNWRASFDVDAIVFEAQRALETPESAARPVAVSDKERDAERTTGYLGAPKAANTAELYLDQIQEDAARDALANDSVAVERSRRVRFLNDRINAAAYKIEKTPMTPEQRRVFEKPALAKYSQLAQALSGDQTNGLAALLAFERYERLGGGDAGRALQQAALRMTTSRSEPCRKLGRAFDAIYDNPNVKAYVSEALINRLLPVRDPEFAVVQERILDNPVVGTRRVDTQVSIQLIPDPNRLLMNLNVEGRAVANTSSEVFSAKLKNQSYVNYYGRKTIEWRDAGVAYSPASVSANATNRLNSVETNVDFVPLVGDVAREITRTQYEARQYEIREETRQKTAQETRERFDREANERFDALNQRLRSNFFRNMANLGLTLKTQRSRTTDDWLLASLRLASDSSLGCQQTEPATLPGAFADVKLHESAINAFLAQLEFAGKTMTPRQALDYLAVKLNKPQLKSVQIESDADLAFTFAKSDPIIVRFFEDQIQITLRFERLTLNGNAWDDLEVETCYRPTLGETGAPALARDGVVSIYGVASAKDQIPIRAIFSKVFAANKTFELRPQVLQEDERFAGLTLGLCRVSRGWFAISVTRDAKFKSESIPSRTL